MTPITGFLFDVDGTLVDSNEQHTLAWVHALNKNGVSNDPAKIRSAIGMGGDHILRKYFDIDPESKQGVLIQKTRGQIFRSEYLPSVKAFDHAKELLQTLKAKAFRLVIATSSSATDLADILEQTHLTGLVEMEVTANDADRSKPSPDIIQAALTKAKLHPSSVFMVGDTPYDIRAANSAKVRTIGLECGGWSKPELLTSGAATVYAHPGELLETIKAGRLIS